MRNVVLNVKAIVRINKELLGCQYLFNPGESFFKENINNKLTHMIINYQWVNANNCEEMFCCLSVWDDSFNKFLNYRLLFFVLLACGKSSNWLSHKILLSHLKGLELLIYQSKSVDKSSQQFLLLESSFLIMSTMRFKIWYNFSNNLLI